MFVGNIGYEILFSVSRKFLRLIGWFWIAVVSAYYPNVLCDSLEWNLLNLNFWFAKNEKFKKIRFNIHKLDPKIYKFISSFTKLLTQKCVQLTWVPIPPLLYFLSSPSPMGIVRNINYKLLIFFLSQSALEIRNMLKQNSRKGLWCFTNKKNIQRTWNGSAAAERKIARSWLLLNPMNYVRKKEFFFAFVIKIQLNLISLFCSHNKKAIFVNEYFFLLNLACKTINNEDSFNPHSHIFSLFYFTFQRFCVYCSCQKFHDLMAVSRWSSGERFMKTFKWFY